MPTAEINQEASEENKEAPEDLEEKAKLEAIKKQDRVDKAEKLIHKLYSESFFRRLLRLVDIYISIATVSPNAS